MLLVNDVLKEAAVVAERIRSGIERECSPERDASVLRQITASLSVAPLAEDTQTLDELIRTADRQMYRAKRAGKNRISVG